MLTGGELGEMDEATLDRKINRIGVFARVTPPQKVRIVRALQRVGRVVAMVGDGANDAPAIRLANVGIAVGEQSTTAARAAADIVLTDARLETLVDAVLEGRAMWAAVRDAVSILVGGNLGEIGFTLGAGLIDGRPPLNARQLLLVNLLTDVAPAMAIALRPPARLSLERLANEGPEASLGQLLNRQIAMRAGVTALGASVAWGIARLTGTRTRANTVGLVALVGTQLGQTLFSRRAQPPGGRDRRRLGGGPGRHHPDSRLEPRVRLPSARAARLDHRSRRLGGRDGRCERTARSASSACARHPPAPSPRRHRRSFGESGQLGRSSESRTIAGDHDAREWHRIVGLDAGTVGQRDAGTVGRRTIPNPENPWDACLRSVPGERSREWCCATPKRRSTASHKRPTPVACTGRA